MQVGRQKARVEGRETTKANPTWQKRAEQAAVTPPRKRPQRPAAEDGLASHTKDAKASASGGASSEKPSEGPQVVFSPGKRLRADGTRHDAGAEVRAFLRQQGYSDQDIRKIMLSDATGGGSVPRRGPSAASGTTSGDARQESGSDQAPQRFADLARAVQSNSGGTAHDDFEADLLDVLGTDEPTEVASGSLAGKHSAAVAPMPLTPSAPPARIPEVSQHSQQPSQASSILSQIPPVVQADMCAVADEMDREFQASQEATRAATSSTAPVAISQASEVVDPLRLGSTQQIQQPTPAPVAAGRPEQPAWTSSQWLGTQPSAGVANPSVQQWHPQPTVQSQPPFTQQQQPQLQQHQQSRQPQQEMQQHPFHQPQGPQPHVHPRPLHEQHLYWQQQQQQQQQQQLLHMQQMQKQQLQQQQLHHHHQQMQRHQQQSMNFFHQPGSRQPPPLMAFATSQAMPVVAPGGEDDDDDADLFAAIRQVEDKVKAERDNERIMKENAAQLDLELMLVDVDAA